MEAVRLHGRDWKKVSEFTGKDYNKVNSYAYALLKKIEKNPSTPGAEIYPILARKTKSHGTPKFREE